ncbi:MAG TPA: hypothetical protein VIL69_14045 [Roseomonas sp.]
MRRPPSPAVLVGLIILLGLGLLTAFGLGFGGMGMAHVLAGLIIAVVGGAAAMMGWRK